ncbi:MAG: beta-N-acetylhexosaminidase [Phycisphaerae bacterium]|nr:beta-N-acetylhexosaminidase [Phycisphaerae bacterium]
MTTAFKIFCSLQTAVFFGAFLLPALSVSAAEVSPVQRAKAPASLIPYPQQVQWHSGQCILNTCTIVHQPSTASPQMSDIVNSLVQILQSAGSKVSTEGNAAYPIWLVLNEQQPNQAAEAYHLLVTADKTVVTASKPAGLFYGVQTIRQLLQQENGRIFLPCCEMTDWPAFPYRGFMHDVGRNYQDIELLKRHLDIMAHYKLNLFHFHLTDDPGWRIECRMYPQLNEPQNYRPTRQPGKYYTYEQINDLIAYARQRCIQIVPEIDMPGHSEYFKKAFGFEMQDAEGIAVLKNILNEFFEQVNTPWFHMGSDEVQLKNPAFMKEMADFIRSKGKTALVWRPGHLPDTHVITQLWTGQSRPVEGVPYLDSQANYINHMDPLVGPIRLFFQQPCRTPAGNDMALGGILCHWPDVNISSQMDIYTQSPVYPALVTYAERIWRGLPANREDCWAKLPPAEDPGFQDFAAFEKDLIVHRDRFFQDIPFPYVKQTDICWKLIGPFDHKNDPAKAFEPEEQIRDDYVVEGRRCQWVQARGGTIHINHFFGFEGHLPPAASGTAYGLTYLHSEKEQDMHFWIGFNGYSRSDRRRGAPNPAQGQWSNVHSAVWVNDQPVGPPVWKQPDAGTSLEIPFVDEDYFYRPPVRIKLRAGWNKILIKAPKAPPAWKWMFTCVPVEWDGRRAVEAKGLVFSTAPQ